MKVEILGTGCPKCTQLARNAEVALAELGLAANLAKVTDIVEIADRGALMTPALAVDGEIKLSGRVATVEEIKGILAP
jgi:small redox-active disulfide protein 2